MKNTPRSSPAAALRESLAAERRRWRKKRFRLKVKFFFSFLLPLILVLAAVQAARTWIRIQMRALFTQAPGIAGQGEKGPAAKADRPEGPAPAPGCDRPDGHASPAAKKPVPIERQAVDMQFITPQPVGKASGEELENHF